MLFFIQIMAGFIMSFVTQNMLFLNHARNFHFRCSYVYLSFLLVGWIITDFRTCSATQKLGEPCCSGIIFFLSDIFKLSCFYFLSKSYKICYVPRCYSHFMCQMIYKKRTWYCTNTGTN